jgi:hypothetical protein
VEAHHVTGYSNTSQIVCKRQLLSKILGFIIGTVAFSSDRGQCKSVVLNVRKGGSHTRRWDINTVQLYESEGVPVTGRGGL